MSQTWFLVLGIVKQRQAKLLATEETTFQLGSQADSNRLHSRLEGSECTRQSKSEQSEGEIWASFRIK